MKSKIRTSLLASLALLMVVAQFARAGDLRVQLDRERVSLGETLNLQVTSDGAESGDPDFSSLAKDFEILSQGQSRVTSIINGAMSHTRQWNLELAPKRLGRLTIPPLTLGGSQSQAEAVEVVAADQPGQAGQAGGPRALFVEAEAAVKSPYVQQAFDYKVKVYFSQQPQRAALADPVADGASIQRVGEDRSYDQFVGNKHYAVIERHYLIIPQRSGELTIQGPRLEALIPDRSARRPNDPFSDLDQAFGGSMFQDFANFPGFGQPSRKVVERAKDLALQVRPQPATGGANWLPATSVQLSDEWTPTPPVFKVGEPVTRTLTITASGVTAAQLPDLSLGVPDGAQFYPDQPHGEDLPGAGSPNSVKTFKVALVPIRPGTLRLPEIRLAWWDTVQDRPREAVIPARTIDVMPAPGERSKPPSVAPASQSEPAQSSPPVTPAPAQPAPLSSTAGRESVHGGAGYWPWLTLGFAVIWVGTLIWWLVDRRSRQSTAAFAGVASSSQGGQSLAAAYRAVETACKGNDPRAVRVALLSWARARWSDQPPQGLIELAVRLGGGADAQELLMSIDRAIYANAESVWDGAAAWAGLAPLLGGRGRSGKAAEQPLPELYPKV